MSINNFTSNLGLSVLPDTNDGKAFPDLFRVYNAIRILASNLDTYTGVVAADIGDQPNIAPATSLLIGNQCRMYIKFDVAATYGQPINIYNNTERRARLADAATPNYAHAFCNSLSVAADNYGEVVLIGALAINGITPGAYYYLGNTAGTIGAAVGTNKQVLGFGLDTTHLFFNPQLMG